MPILKLWVRQSPLRPLPPLAEVDEGVLSQTWAALLDVLSGTAESGLDKDAALAAATTGRGRNKAGMCREINR